MKQSLLLVPFALLLACGGDDSGGTITSETAPSYCEFCNGKYKSAYPFCDPTDCFDRCVAMVVGATEACAQCMIEPDPFPTTDLTNNCYKDLVFKARAGCTSKCSE